MTELRIIIAGSRDFCDDALVRTTLDDFLAARQGVRVSIISGTARGADQLGERYAAERGYDVMRFPADWNRYGRAAGPMRNERMAQAAVADGALGVLFAFWDGQSRGTQSMIALAKRYGLEVHVVRF